MQKRFTIILLFLIHGLIINAQDNNQNLIKGAPDVFLDCEWDCDFDAFRNNIKYVNFVRDRQSSNVHVMVTSQDSGTGGEKISLYFTGYKKYKGQNDTLVLFTKSDATDKIINDAIMESFKKGMLSYLLQSSLKEKISYSINIEEGKKEEKIIDPWNSWVFSTQMSAFFFGESNYNNLNLWGSINADRVTKMNKVNFRISSSYRTSNFYFRDSLENIIEDETIVSIRRSNFLSASYVHGIHDHFSVGVFGSAFSNLFSNYNFSTSVNIGAEYNFYKYEDSDRQQFTIVYKIGPTYNDYVEETLLFKESELLFAESIEVGFYQKQNWGNIYAGTTFKHYLHNFDKNRLSFSLDFDWNVTKGLTVGFGGNLSFIGDQLNLPKSIVDIEDVLLRDRLLATSYSLFSRVNVRYSFGSKYNNVVNSRFEGGNNNYYY